jgi:multiple sugar transport system ATP-binding protein
MANICLEAVSKRFGSFTAVNGMSLDVDDGEFVAILGPSGCGKTTTMNMIAGIERPNEGTIRFDGVDVTRVPVQKRGVGFVFQNYAIFTHLTVRQNLGFSLEMQGIRGAELSRRVAEMAEFMALTTRLEEPSSRLSVNELQKLAIGRSAIAKPRIFLLDEPLSNLDAAFRERMRSELRQLQRALKQTMIYVTHDQIEAMGLADRIAIMDGGVLKQFATPSTIYSAPDNVFVARFVGAPSMNILPATLTEQGEFLAIRLGGQPSQPITLDARLSAIARTSGLSEIIFGFRPETITIVDTFGRATMSAEVDIVETVGRRRLIHFTLGPTRFIGVFGRATAVRPGDAVHLSFDLASCHLFDPQSQRRLSLQGHAVGH